MEESNEFKLGENERVVRVVYHHLEIIFFNLAISFLILILDFFLMYFFFLQGTWGVIVFTVILLIVAGYVFRLVFLYRTNKFILTNKRIVDFEQTGFWAKRISAVPYEKIVAVEAIVKGVRAHWFKYGNLRLDMGKNGRSFELYKIKRPIEVQAIINDIVAGKFNLEEDKQDKQDEQDKQDKQDKQDEQDEQDEQDPEADASHRSGASKRDSEPEQVRFWASPAVDAVHHFRASEREGVAQPVFKAIEIREPKREKADQNEEPEKKLNKIVQILKDVEGLTVREKEDLLCVLEEELREVSRDA